MLLITIIGNVFPLMWVEFWRFFGSVLEKAWKGPPWVLEVNSSCAVECFSVLRHRLTGQKLEMVHGKFLAPRVEEDQWTILFIYLFIYLSFFEPPPCLCNNCLFLLRQIYPWVLYNSHISLFPVPVFENSINERTWLVTHMTYLVLKKSFICLL